MMKDATEEDLIHFNHFDTSNSCFIQIIDTSHNNDAVLYLKFTHLPQYHWGDEFSKEFSDDEHWESKFDSSTIQDGFESDVRIGFAKFGTNNFLVVSISIETNQKSKWDVCSSFVELILEFADKEGKKAIKATHHNQYNELFSENSSVLQNKLIQLARFGRYTT